LQIEPNYRLRIITNIEDVDLKNFVDDTIHLQKSASEIYESEKILAFNLEIRKLQFNDSGWYECQLNTKPTIKNYIYLKVLSLYLFFFYLNLNMFY
jgi:hypothetical protein